MYQEKEMFFEKIIIILTILEKNLSFKKKLFFKKIKKFLDKDLICIVQYPNLEFDLICKSFFQKNFKKTGIILKNSEYNLNNIYEWIKTKIKKKKIYLQPDTINKILSVYNCNINKINNTLNIFSLLYPKTEITNQIIDHYYNCFENIESYHWINSIIHGKKNISIKILKKLRIQEYTFNNLIFHYKKLIYSILKIKEKKINKKNYNPLDICNYPIQYSLLKIITKKNSLIEIHQAIKILKNIDFTIIKNKKDTVWMYLKTLSIIFN